MLWPYSSYYLAFTIREQSELKQFKNLAFGALTIIGPRPLLEGARQVRPSPGSANAWSRDLRIFPLLPARPVIDMDNRWAVNFSDRS